MQDLLEMWENKIALELRKDKKHFPNSGSRFDDMYIQSSFEFDTPPRVIYVSDIHTRTPVNFYDDLPPVPLVAGERQVIEGLLTRILHKQSTTKQNNT